MKPVPGKDLLLNLTLKRIHVNPESTLYSSVQTENNQESDHPPTESAQILKHQPSCKAQAAGGSSRATPSLMTFPRPPRLPRARRAARLRPPPAPSAATPTTPRTRSTSLLRNAATQTRSRSSTAAHNASPPAGRRLIDIVRHVIDKLFEPSFLWLNGIP